MIQRIQTVYLFVAFLASTLLFFNIPVAVFQITFPTSVELPFNLMSTYQSVNTIPLIVLNVIVVGLSFASILLYSKRTFQFRLTMFAFLAEVVFILVLFLFSIDSIQVYLINLYKDKNIQASYKLGAFMPLISLVLLILASKAIRKDEKLVKGTDRLR